MPIGSVTLGWVSFVLLCSGSSGAVASLERYATLRLLETLRAVTGDFVGVCCVVA